MKHAHCLNKLMPREKEASKISKKLGSKLAIAHWYRRMLRSIPNIPNTNAQVTKPSKTPQYILNFWEHKAPDLGGSGEGPPVQSEAQEPLTSLEASDPAQLAEIGNLIEECRESTLGEGADAELSHLPDVEVQQESQGCSVMDGDGGTGADSTSSPQNSQKLLSLSAAAGTLTRLGAWVQRARQAAASQMAKEEFELSQVRLITEDQLPPPEDRVYPRPNLIKYKWVLCTCFEHDWKLLRCLACIQERDASRGTQIERQPPPTHQ